MAKRKKRRSEAPAEGGPGEAQRSDGPGEDEIDFPTVVWSLAILIVLVVIHRLIWGG